MRFSPIQHQSLPEDLVIVSNPSVYVTGTFFLLVVNFYTFFLQSGDDNLTLDNKQFLEEVLQDKSTSQAAVTSPLANVNAAAVREWDERTRRVGLIARKIGNYPLWLKDGSKVQTTLLQVG